MKNLPLKLEKEPLIDALFEIRFDTSEQASNILPGIYFDKYKSEKNKKIERLPASQLPEQVRAVDPNLRFAPILRLNLDQYYILIGDRSLGIACKLPYPGWGKFKPEIMKVVGQLDEANIISTINRYSLKYVDIIPFDLVADNDAIVSVNMSIGKQNFNKDDIYQIKTEVKKDGILNIIQIISNAKATIPGLGDKTGLITDIDSINMCDLSLAEIAKSLPNELEKLHNVNKVLFFECLDPKTLEALGPIYG